MNNSIFFIITIIVALLGGLLVLKYKLPAGIMIGAMLFTAVFNSITGLAYIPSWGRIVSQMAAGGFIGIMIDREVALHIKSQLKSVVVLVIGMVTVNMLIGSIIFALSDLSIPTAFLSATPGGVSDMAIMSADFGADTPKVSIMQFTRMVSSISLFPTFITNIAGKFSKKSGVTIEPASHEKHSSPQQKPNHPILVCAITMLVAAAGGLVGTVVQIPAGVLVFSMLATVIWKLLGLPTYMPVPVRRAAQVLSGAYIGSLFSANDFLELKSIIIPAIILVAGYYTLCPMLGFLLHKVSKLDLKTCLLSTVPAGASDMALIAADLGADTAEVGLFHIVRLMGVMTICPQLILLMQKFMT